MPITLKADDIRQRAERSFDGRVESATADKIARVGRVANALIDALSAELEAHFERQEKAQRSPYPDISDDGGTQTRWNTCARLCLSKFRGVAENEVALAGEDEAVEVWRRVATAFKDAGFSLREVPWNKRTNRHTVEVFVSDPEFVP